MTKSIQNNQKGIVFVPILIGVLLVVTGVAMISEGTGHHLSLSGSSTSDQSVSPLPTESPVQLIASGTSASPNFDYEGAKAAGYSDKEIQEYLASKSQNSSSITPKPQVAKASDKALRLAAYILTASNEAQRNEIINKFSNGKNDLKSAVTNLALLLDSKPEALALVEKTINQDLSQRLAKNSQEEDSNEIVEYHQKEVERLENLNKSLGVYSQNNAYIGKAQNTNNTSLSQKEIKPRLTQENNVYIGAQTTNHVYEPSISKYSGPTTYNAIGNTVYGSDGTTYNKIGNTIYKSDGTTFTGIGNRIYGSDGSEYSSIGNTVYDNKGTSYNQIGNTVYGSDGSTATSIGDTLYVSPGY